MKHGRAISILFLSSIGWGLTWLPAKLISQMGLDSMHLVFIAFSSAGALLIPFIVKQWKTWQGSFPLLFLISILGGLANLLFQTALVHGDVVRVMILFYLLPVWSVLGGWYVLKEKPDGIRIGAVVISLLGALLILNVDSQTFKGLSWIDIVAIGSGMAFAFNNILFRKTAAQPVAGKVGAMFIGCAVLMGTYLLVEPSRVPIPAGNAAWYAALYGIAMLMLITFGTQWGVTQLEAGRAALIIVMELVAAVVSVAMLTDTVLTTREIAGAFLVLSAAVIEGWREPNAESVAS